MWVERRCANSARCRGVHPRQRRNLARQPDRRKRHLEVRQQGPPHGGRGIFDSQGCGGCHGESWRRRFRASVDTYFQSVSARSS